MSVEPAAGAEDGSLHWVASDKNGNRVWMWKVSFWFPHGTSMHLRPEAAHELGWRYIGPASPNDARALAEARAEVAALTAQVDAFRAALQSDKFPTGWEIWSGVQWTPLGPMSAYIRRAAISHHSAGEDRS